jgi:hypothetical protein
MRAARASVGHWFGRLGLGLGLGGLGLGLGGLEVDWDEAKQGEEEGCVHWSVGALLLLVTVASCPGQFSFFSITTTIKTINARCESTSITFGSGHGQT